jgi:hypothetical protein
MRFILFPAVIFLILFTPIHAQITIHGKIVDEDSGTPLENVNVFLANTSLGTASGKNGEFIINNVPFGTYDIVFSYVGYETEKRNLSSYQENIFRYNISLKPKPISINEVNITGNIPEEWKENLKIFTRIFIGETDNSEKTKILNPEVLNFVRDANKNSLKAYSDSVIRIENKALGYMIYIILDWLQLFQSGSIKYMFYPRFQELTPASEEEKRTWEKNRQKTYLDSPKHFFYDLVHNQLYKDYYTLHELTVSNLGVTTGANLFPKDLDLSCGADSSTYQLKLTGGLAVRRSLDPPSFIKFDYPTIIIDKYGNLITTFYTVEYFGYWADKRIADILPLEYVYEGK